MQYLSGRSGSTCEINAQNLHAHKSTAKHIFEIGGTGVLLLKTRSYDMGVYFANNDTSTRIVTVPVLILAFTRRYLYTLIVLVLSATQLTKANLPGSC